MRFPIYKVFILTMVELLFLEINFSLANDVSSLFTTHQANKVGDIVTVIIYESSLASQSAKTQTNQETQAAGKITPFFQKNKTGSVSSGWGSNNSYGGSGSTQRRGSLIAEITAEVIEVLPNGNLRIKGERTVKINDEKQIIYLEGIIRPEDIQENNTIRSTYIAKANIKYEGEGPIKKSQHAGFIPQAFNWLIMLGLAAWLGII
ncbi:flagellar basal body L-ring protein FlgH [Candidatus Aerophobetes bacterium]|nr:flagellar basal body L-ring protein FlgH [Candidatus Aerophobetes bacterium]